MLPILCLQELSSSLATNIIHILLTHTCMGNERFQSSWLSQTSLGTADTETNESACRDTLSGASLWFIKTVPEQCSINALYHWKLAAVWAGLLNFAAPLRVKNGRIWVLGIGRNKNLKSEQPGDRSIHPCISLRVGLCISRWQPKNNMCWESWRCMARFSTPTQTFWGVLSVRGCSGIYELLLCGFLQLLSVDDQPRDVGGKFEGNFYKMEYDN